MRKQTPAIACNKCYMRASLSAWLHFYGVCPSTSGCTGKPVEDISAQLHDKTLELQLTPSASPMIQ